MENTYTFFLHLVISQFFIEVAFLATLVQTPTTNLQLTALNFGTMLEMLFTLISHFICQAWFSIPTSTTLVLVFISYFDLNITFS